MPESMTTSTLSADPAPVAAKRLIVRHDRDGGTPSFDTMTGDLSGLMRIAADPTVTGVELDGVSQLMWQPTDPAYGLQWEDRLTGLETAWDTTRGDPGVVIAVIDSGINPGPEFGARLLAGRSFTDSDPHIDTLGHGTSVAAVAAAEADNGTAGAGVCSACAILPVQVTDVGGLVPWSAAAKGIIWAVDQGADILNLSFGSQSPSSVLSDAIDYALGRGVVVVVVAAAGNYGTVYPADHPGVISVAGHDKTFSRSSWSSYGQWVDVAAPGCVLGPSADSPTMVCGTSFASPWTAGAAALLLSASDGPLTPCIPERAFPSLGGGRVAWPREESRL